MKMQQFIRDYMKITLGPLLLIMAFVVFLSKYSWSLAFLGALAGGSLPFIWRFQTKAAIITLGLILFSFLTLYTFQESSYPLLWIFVWCLALAAGVMVTALCSKEYHADKLQRETQTQEERAQLEHGYQVTQKHLEADLEEYASQMGVLQQTLKHKEQEILSFKQLITASKEEADKYFMQAQHLSEEVQKLFTELSASNVIALENLELKARTKKLLDELNALRVQSYQYEMLAFSSHKPAPREQHSLAEEHQPQEILKEMEELLQERDVAKQSYQQHLRDYQALADKLHTFFTLDEIAYYTQREISLEAMYEELREAFQEKSYLLQEIRMEIFKIEGSILQLKKTLNIPVEETLGPDSYLAVADQECLRLEEENAVLLQLLSQTLPLLEQRLEKKSTKEASEFHNLAE